MTNKEIVKSILPNAEQESHVAGFERRRYYLIRNGRDSMYLSEGKTVAEAWKNALPVVLEYAKESIKLLDSIKPKSKD